MKYLIQIYSNPASRVEWEGLSPEQQAEDYELYERISDELVASGELIAGEALADISLAKRVTRHDSATSVSDGPFAEITELLAGFYLVDCENEARAVEIAALFPESQSGLVEVRQVLEIATGADV